VDYQKLSSDRLGESSEMIRKRVQAARDLQHQRFSKGGSSDIICNADIRVAEVRQFCKLDEAGESLIRAAMGQMNLSARGYHRMLKLARTIADLAGSENIQSVHLAEALQYRPKLTARQSSIDNHRFVFTEFCRERCFIDNFFSLLTRFHLIC
jgi:magnesium chelatase family protein